MDFSPLNIAAKDRDQLVKKGVIPGGHFSNERGQPHFFPCPPLSIHNTNSLSNFSVEKGAYLRRQLYSHYLMTFASTFSTTLYTTFLELNMKMDS